MALVPWRRRSVNPFEQMEQLRDEINQLFDWERPYLHGGLLDRSAGPRMDLVENADAYVATVELPGVRKEDIDVQVNGKVLTIKGVRHDETRDEDKNREDVRVYRQESMYGEFQRSISLPVAADPSKVSARLEQGVLTLELPKREELKPKKIDVKIA